MQEGNRLYDGSGLGGQHTSIYTALDLLPNDVGIAAKGDIGIRNNADCATVFARVGKLAQEKVLNIAGVLVHHPYSFAVLFCHDGSATLFDSHSHPAVDQGACISHLRYRRQWSTFAEYVCDLYIPNKIIDGHLVLLELR